jgi:ABC-type lipoprotein release transport system permease subunit
MRRFVDIAWTGLVAVRLHPLRSAATLACLLVVLLPYSAGLALSQGLQAEAEAAIRGGADLYVTGSQFGRTVPVPLTAVASIRRLDGVTAVTPRIVGSIVLGRSGEQAVLVGLPPDQFPQAATCIDGRLSVDGNVHELVIGTELARRLRLDIGSVIPPFYRSDAGEKLSTVVGIFRTDVPLWQANLVLTTFDSAAAIFNQRGLATDLLVECRPGAEESVRSQIVQQIALGPPGDENRVRSRVTARADLEALLPAGLLHREGVFNLIWLLALVVAILVVAVTSGFGLSHRRREIGILKATGWQTDEILLRSAVESVTLALLAAALALVLAWLWLAWLNGYGIAAVFFAGAGIVPSFAIPYRFAPVAALVPTGLALTVTLTGTLYSSWRAATVSPRDALR